MCCGVWCVVWVVGYVDSNPYRHQSSIAIRSGFGSSWQASEISCAPRQLMSSDGSLEPQRPDGTRAESGQRDNAASGVSIIICLRLLLLLIFILIIVICIFIVICHYYDDYYYYHYSYHY